MCVCVYEYLYVLIQTLQGVDVQPLLAGLQTADDFLTLDLPWSDGQSGQASSEVLSEPRLGHLPTYKYTQPYTHTLTVKAVCKISPPELGAQDCERFVVALVALLFLHPISPMQSAQEQNLSEEVQIIYKIVAAGQRNSKH